MATESKKKRFLLTFVGFPPDGKQITEVITDCEKMTISVVNNSRNYALQLAKKRGINMKTMSLINSLEVEYEPESQEGESK